MTPQAKQRDEFARALEEAAQEFDEAARDAARPSAAGLRQALDRLSDLWSRHAYVPAGFLANLYAAERPAPEPVSQVRPEHEIVAEELNLKGGLSAEELNRIRRAFALANHPDRVPPSARERATLRMTIANALIDQALKDGARRAPRPGQARNA